MQLRDASLGAPKAPFLQLPASLLQDVFAAGSRLPSLPEKRFATMSGEHHPGSFFGITTWGTESFFEDNSLSIYNSTLSLDKWRKAFKKCDFDNSDSIDRESIPDVVQYLYWGRTPRAEEMDDFMLYFNADPALGKLTWDEFKGGLDDFRREPSPAPDTPTQCSPKKARRNHRRDLR